MPTSTPENQTHPQAQNAPGIRSVHFSQGGLKGGAGQPALGAILIPFIIAYGWVVVPIVFISLAGTGGVAAVARFAAITLAIIAGLVLGIRVIAKSIGRSNNAAKLPLDMDQSADLNVVAWTDQAEHLKQVTAAEFEPEVFRVLIASRRSRARKRGDQHAYLRQTLAVGTIIAITLGGMVILDRFILPYLPGTIPGASVIVAASLAAAGLLAYLFIHPTYLRFVPGRLDVLRYTWFGGPPKVESIDLRNTIVRLDARRRELLIGGWHPSHPGGDVKDDKPSAFEQLMLASDQNKDPQGSLGSRAQATAMRIVPFWASLSPNQITEAAYKAAASNAEPGPIPMDRL